MKHTLLKLFTFFVLGASAQTYTINTLAGKGAGGYSGDGGPATAAELKSPADGFPDASGNIYIADELNNRVRIVNTAGIISTFAGNGIMGFSGDNGPATGAELYYPTDVSTDGSGNVYIKDFENNRVRKINNAGIISTIAGNGIAGYSGDGGPATAAEINFSWSMYSDDSGNIYIAEGTNNRIRKVNTAGIINTIAGTGTAGYSGDGGPATAAKLNNPTGVYSDISGNVYIAEYQGYRIRMVNTAGIISTIAGTGAAGYSGDGGPATAAKLDWPDGVCSDSLGNIYIADYAGNRIRMVNTNGIINTIAGNGTGGYSGDGGPATGAELYNPTRVHIAPSGNIYIADWANNRIRTLALTCTLTVTTCSPVNVTCNGSNNGCLSACPGGGTPPYTYLWAPNGGTGNNACNLTAGCYTITVVDMNGCRAIDSGCITQPTPLTLSVTATPDTVCAGGCSTLKVVASGGSPPYNNYAWSNGATTSSINVCPPNTTTYTVSVFDSHGCITDSTITVIVNTCVGIPGINSSISEFLLYPNPNNGIFTLEVKSEEVRTKSALEVYNMLGQQIKTEVLTNKKTAIDLSSQPNGIYLYRLITETGNLVSEGKFIIAK
jgi:hypothetical protein